MKRAIALGLLCLGLATSASATPDKKGCADHPLLPTRMPDYFIENCQVRDFDAYGFFEPTGWSWSARRTETPTLSPALPRGEGR